MIYFSISMLHCMKERSVSRAKALWLLTCCYLVAFVLATVTFRLLSSDLPVLVRTLLADVVATVVVFVFSVFCDNSSMYDPYWSVAPPILYGTWIWLIGRFGTIWSWLFLLAMLFWAIRLTVNCITHWGGLQDEDWRYVSFRKKFGKGYWPISFLAVHFFPTVIVFICSIPAWFLFSGPVYRPVYAAAGIVLIVVGTLLELFADHQMTSFQRKRKSPEESCVEGLWRYSRHPNYLGEITVWWGVCVASFASMDTPMWFLVFPCAMTALFLGYSIPAMEKRQLARRPSYQAVLDEVPMLLPIPGRRAKKRDAGVGAPTV